MPRRCARSCANSTRNPHDTRRLPAPRRRRSAGRAARPLPAARGRDLPRRQLARRAAEDRAGPHRRGGRQGMGRGPDPLLEQRRLVRAAPGEVVCTDSTSINLYKVLFAALGQVLQMLPATPEASPARRVVLSERSNFPTDLYIAESICRERGFTLRLIEADELPAALDREVAVLMLTHVNYRTGAMHDMKAVTAAAHAVGALTVWDLAHSAGAVPVALNDSEADFAVGCGYKYLNGGPGAPAFVWVHQRHAGQFAQPLSGWWGHVAPFEFTPHYRPAPGVARYLCGTQPIIALAGLECGIDSVLAAEPFDAGQGPMAALRAKSLALTDAFITLIEARCPGRFDLVTPREHAQRG